jgi:uncharacterized surface protein with fasciclin (FAS1) repeats
VPSLQLHCSFIIVILLHCKIATPVKLYSLTMKIIASFALLLASSTVSARIAATANTAPRELDQTLTIAGNLGAEANFSTLVAATSLYGIYSFLGNASLSDTLFAPVNSAFARLNASALQKFESLPYSLHLINFLAYHVYEHGVVLSTNLTSTPVTLTMGNNETLTITSSSAGVTLSNSMNGIMATVIKADIVSTNGVIQAIDGVLLPSFFSITIADFVASTSDLTTLYQLVVAANLESSFRNESFTLLAPNNAAFSALGATTLTTLSNPANVLALQYILAYHAIPIVVSNITLDTSNPYATVAGPTLSISAAGVINGGAATIISPDNLAFNGIVNVINAVLIPPTNTTTGSTNNTTGTTMAPAMSPSSAKAPSSTGGSKAPSSGVSGGTSMPTVTGQTLAPSVSGGGSKPAAGSPTTMGGTPTMMAGGNSTTPTTMAAGNSTKAGSPTTTGGVTPKAPAAASSAPACKVATMLFVVAAAMAIFV